MANISEKLVLNYFMFCLKLLLHHIIIEKNSVVPLIKKIEDKRVYELKTCLNYNQATKLGLVKWMVRQTTRDLGQQCAAHSSATIPVGKDFLKHREEIVTINWRRENKGSSLTVNFMQTGPVSFLY